MSATPRAIGPVWSNWGFRTWSLLLRDDHIIAVPYTTWEAIKLNFHLQIGFPADPGGSIREDRASFDPMSRLGHRYYAVPDLASITAAVNYGQNHIILTTIRGERDHYRIFKRHDTKQWMQLLQDKYPQLYLETGVPMTFLGRVLKG